MDGIYWFSGLNTQDKDKYAYYIEMYSVAFITALVTTPNIKPYLILDGEIDEHIQKLIDKGLTVIKHRSLFYDDLVNHYKNDTIALGAYLRIDIPKICEELNIDSDYILYTDNDVMFLDDVSDLKYKTAEYFRCSGEANPVFSTGAINSGVMWMNWRNMLKVYDNFVYYIKNNFNKFNVYDQDAIMQFFNIHIQELEYTYNYKPYWGESYGIKILHFHGPKPAHVNSKDSYPYPFMFTDFYYKMVDKYKEIYRNSFDDNHNITY